MKRLPAIMPAYALALTALVCASAEDAENEWYMLEEGGLSIAIRLPGNATDGLDWKCEISAPGVMEPTGKERLSGESEGLTGVPFMRMFHFAAKAAKVEPLA